jgi:putative nucleotidyltransferase with HDIG domain
VSAPQAILERIQAIPALPHAVLEVSRAARDPDADLGKLVRTIEYDPGLTSNLLRWANAAYFAGRRPMGSVREPMVRLGLQRVAQMVLAGAVAPACRRSVAGYDLPAGALWEHSVAVAAAAAELAKALRLGASDELFTAGLLHDIGKVVLGTFLEVSADPIMALAFEQGLPFDEAERRIIGVDHAEAGGLSLEHWNLPATIVAAARWHHQPDAMPERSVAVDLIHVADALAMVGGLGIGRDGLNYRASAGAMERLKVSAETAEQVIYRMVVALQDLKDLLSGPG